MVDQIRQNYNRVIIWQWELKDTGISNALLAGLKLLFIHSSDCQLLGMDT